MKFISNNKGLLIFLILCCLWWIVGAILMGVYGNFYLFKIIHTTHNPSFDTFFIFNTLIGEFSVIFTVLIFILVLFYRSWMYFALFVATQLFPFIINQIFKFSFSASRPFAIWGEETWFHKIDGVDLHSNLSFPSGHTAGAFSFFTLLCILLPKKYSFLAIIYFLIACSVAYSRIYLGQHFYEDIYVGSMVGCITSILFYWIWLLIFKKKSSM